MRNPARPRNLPQPSKTRRNHLPLLMAFAAWVAVLALWAIRGCRDPQMEKVKQEAARYAFVVEQARGITEECTLVDVPYRSGKAITAPPVEEWPWTTRWLGKPALLPANPDEVNMVVFVDSHDNAWGTASGTVVLLRQREKFTFSVSSGIAEKKLGSSILAGDYVAAYLADLPERAYSPAPVPAR
jgi:hypothetical protein